MMCRADCKYCREEDSYDRYRFPFMYQIDGKGETTFKRGEKGRPSKLELRLSKKDGVRCVKDERVKPKKNIDVTSVEEEPRVAKKSRNVGWSKRRRESYENGSAIRAWREIKSSTG